MRLWLLAGGLAATALGGCKPDYSPDTYSANAVQQANKVEQGVLVGVRQVDVSAAGTVGTVTGAAAGGIAGSQLTSGPVSAFTALGGSLVGGIAGSAVEHASADTTAFEYIVRKPNGDLVSVTQKDKVPLALGQKVLVISGAQARVVPDYTLPPDVSAKLDKAARPAAVKLAEPPKPEAAPAEAGAADAKPADPAAGAVAPNQAPSGAASTDAAPPAAAPAADKPTDANPADVAPIRSVSPSTTPSGAASSAVAPAADNPATAAPTPTAPSNPVPSSAGAGGQGPAPAATP